MKARICFLLIVGLVLMWLGTKNGQAQDFHFSQFYATPTLLNPGMTGNINGQYRAGIINKTHMFSGANRYQTVHVFGDMTLLEDQLARESWLGLGLHALYDDAGMGLLRTFNIGASVAFHKALVEDQLYFSAGIDFSYVRKQFGLGSVYFNNQYTETGFNGTVNSMEAFERDHFAYLDVSSGLGFSYSYNKNLRLNLGASFLHVNRPLETLYFTSNTSGNNRRFVRPILQLTAEWMHNRFGLQPGVFYSQDRGSQELIVGTHMTYTIFEDTDGYLETKAYLGAWHRLGETVIISMGMELGSYRLMLSYDLNTQLIQSESPNRNGFEVSLVHVGKFQAKDSKLYCPRF